MFHADYYELGASLDRADRRNHLLNLPKCDECGGECCTNYLRVEPYTACPVCGDYGVSAEVVEGRILCDRCY